MISTAGRLYKAATPAPQGRMWIGTLNNPDMGTAEDILSAWHTKGGAAYVTGQVEKGNETGTIHLQFYLHFDSNRRLASLKKICPKSHFSIVRVNNGADDYCNKDETRVEGPWTFGIKPARSTKAGDKKRRNADLIAKGAEQAVADGDIDIKDYPKVKAAIDLYLNCTRRPDFLEGEPSKFNFWIYGRPGVGKTRKVVTDHPTYYDKDKSKYWNGFTDQQAVLIDDVEMEDTYMLAMLKKICQNKPFSAEDKFGQLRQVRPKHVYVTSNFHYHEIWKNAIDRDALARRFTVIHMDNPFDV